MNGTRTDVDDFETRLRVELHRRADELVVRNAQPRFAPSPRARTHSMAGVDVAGVLIGIALVATLLARHDGSGSATHLRTQSVPTTTERGPRALVHFAISGPGIRLRVARNLPGMSRSISHATFATRTYRKSGPLQAPVVYASLAPEKVQPLPSDPRNHPKYRALDVAGRRGEIVWLGRDVADFVVRVDEGHTLDLRSWGLTQTELVAAATGVVVHSDSSFELPGLAADLEPDDVDLSSVPGGARAEYSTNRGTLVLSEYAGGLESELGALLFPGSGTKLGATTIEPVSVDGASGLLRIDRGEGSAGTAGEQRLSFRAVWESGPKQAAELAGVASTTTEVSDILNTVARVNDATWRGMVTRADRGEQQP